ncbi:MAG: Cold shock protein of CSP family, partial [uncultured Thermomicrobiales bacterium]
GGRHDQDDPRREGIRVHHARGWGQGHFLPRLGRPGHHVRPAPGGGPRLLRRGAGPARPEPDAGGVRAPARL